MRKSPLRVLSLSLGELPFEDGMARRHAPQEAMMTAPPRLTIFVDVDNTLIDNDAAKQEMDRRLVSLEGQAEAERFWAVYEEVRAEFGVVDIPRALARFNNQDELDKADLVRRMAVADVFLRFSFRDYLYVDALTTLAHLQSLGRVAILSDGDGVFQPIKIARSSLADAVDGFALVYPHKEAHGDELQAMFPAEHYVLIDDKFEVLLRFREAFTAPLTTIFVRQGKYAAAAGPPPWPGADLVVEQIGELRHYDAETLTGAARG
jgi:FMN phosphatase YigB (HAD superfamily)